MKKVLVLCTGNSCRSILAEALINHLGANRYQAFSAGSQPAGYVHPGALETLSRHDIPVQQPSSKSWDAFQDIPLDLVITVCDNANAETCPVFPGSWEKLHWSIPDPAAHDDDPAKSRQAFETAFDMLKNHIEQELL